jgi:phospholipase/carboxylesterase
MITRRFFLTLASAALPLTCAQRERQEYGHLTVRLKPPTRKADTGSHDLGLGKDRDGLLIVPKNYRPETPAPLAVILHGAGGFARRVVSLFPMADDLGIIVLATDSRGRTWDGIRDGFGPDIEFLNRALEYTFDRCAIDKSRVAIGGFSDGATYGLSVGLSSGDLFTHVVACSPGFIIPSPTHGKPKIFISHGTADQILPIQDTSRRIVPRLQAADYDVKYREFDGPHSVPPDIAREGLTWFLGR